jgi:hypothetical protein
MGLVVEDGTGANPLANGYIASADVDSYMAERGKTGWTGSTAVKEAAIINAADYLDSVYMFKGERCADEQPMQWPRYLYPEDARFRNSTEEEPELPVLIQRANAELALLALSGDLMPAASGQRLTSESVAIPGAVSRSRSFYGKGGFSTDRSFPHVDALIHRYITGKVGGTRSSRIERA